MSGIGADDTGSSDVGEGPSEATATNEGTAAGTRSERDADFSLLEGTNPRIAALETELADAKDKHLRALADFENYKRRALKERSELIKYQGEQVFADLLEVADGFERALEHEGADPVKVIEGVRLIQKQLLDTFSRWDVRSESSMGQIFDPQKHRALSKAPAPEGTADGAVVGELKKVYRYKDKILRFGEVVVAQREE